jgi:hypothetical protein
MSNQKILLLFIVLSCFSGRGTTEAQDSTKRKADIDIPGRYFDAILKNANEIQSRLNRHTKKFLRRLEAREKKMKKKLGRKDSILAKEVFGDIKELYKTMQDERFPFSTISGFYSSHLDSLLTCLSFLHRNALADHSRLERLQVSLNGTLNRYSLTEMAGKKLIERERYLLQMIGRSPARSGLQKFRRELEVFQKKFSGYKQRLEDPGRIESGLMEIFAEHPAYRQFYINNSRLSSLFAIPGNIQDHNSQINIHFSKRIQTRISLMQTAGARIAGLDSLNKELLSPGGKLSAVKNKLRSYKTGQEDAKLDGNERLKTNSQTGKTFFQRIELGTNIQSQRARHLFPVSSDIAISAGYKINDNTIAGIGISNRLGYGRGWDAIRISYEGLGVRTFLDHKMKGNLYLTGGYELNCLTFRAISQLKEVPLWQKSGLIGLSRKYKLGKVLKGEMKLLWDFMSYSQKPSAQPILFRLGYSLNKF